MSATTQRTYRVGTDLTAVATERQDAVALAHGGRSVTYRELEDVVDRVAASLLREGVRPDDRVFLLSRSPVEILALTMAAARVGAVTVPANWRLSPAEVLAVHGDSGARLSLVDADLLVGLGDTRPGGDVVPLADGFGDWLSAAGGVEPHPVDGAATALQIYTSGTSGAPKGVLVTHDNLAQKVVRMAAEWGIGPTSVSLLATPLFHIGGLSWGLISLAAGARLVVPPRASTEVLRSAFLDDGVTHAFLVPKMLTDLVRTLTERGERAGSAEVVVCGAAPVSVGLQRQAVAALGCRLLQVYGLTETAGAITQLDASAALDEPDPEAALRSSGTPFPWVELAIRHPEDQRPLPPGVPGEIWTRSPQTCAGYWRRDAETHELLVDGWLRTGDGGFVDAAGRLHVTDRIKDMIVSGGENIYSVEVERALQTHPAVLDAAVVGRPDDEWGEVVVAVVELRPGHELTLDSAAEHVADLLGRYKRPRDLLVVDELPRNSNGKILKREVRSVVAPPRKDTA